MISSDAKYFIKLKLNQITPIRKLMASSLLFAGTCSLACKSYYTFSKLLGKYEKLEEGEILQNRFPNRYSKLKTRRAELVNGEINLIYTSFLKSSKAKSVANLYQNFSQDDAARIRYKNEDDDNREGNLLVLKPPRIEEGNVLERGVLYLQYNSSLPEFAFLFDLEKLYQHFILVFEPSSWGYTDLGLEILLHGKNNLYVMAQDEIDFNLCKLLDSRIIPIRAGAGDWINTELAGHSALSKIKYFDVCMVASWRKLKNHRLLFEKLAALGKGLRIALVGYSWENRTAASIRKEQEALYPDSLVSIFESVPHQYVFKVLAQSKVALMLSEREGANRGIYEALASDTPVVILKSNRGVNKALVDHGCVFYTEPLDLAATVKELIDTPLPYSVRERLFAVSGTKNTWKKICNILKTNERIDLDEQPLIVSTPNLKYSDASVKSAMDVSYTFLKNLLRPL